MIEFLLLYSFIIAESSIYRIFFFFQDAELTEEEMFILNASGDSKVDDQSIQRSALVLRLRDGIGSLARILKAIEVKACFFLFVLNLWFAKLSSLLFFFDQNFKGTVVHVETRPSKQEGIQYDVLVKLDSTRQSLLLLIRSLRQSAALGGVSLLTDNNVNVKGTASRIDPRIYCIFAEQK